MTTLRTMLIAAAALATAATASAGEPAARDNAAAEKLGWRLGMQAYTLRKYTLFEALDRIEALGLKYVELYPGQRLSKKIREKSNQHMSAKALKALEAKLEQTGVRPVCFGVTGLPKTEADARKLFTWAKGLGIETIVTETNRPELDAIAKEYGLNIAFHNHPNSWPPQKVLKAVKGRPDFVGACADTGHWMRAGYEPLATVRKLKGRIISFHLKDLNEHGKRRAHDVPWGTGKAEMGDVLRQLRDQGFQGVFSIEYEHQTPKMLEEIARCIAFFDAQAKKLAKTE